MCNLFCRDECAWKLLPERHFCNSSAILGLQVTTERHSWGVSLECVASWYWAPKGQQRLLKIKCHSFAVREKIGDAHAERWEQPASAYCPQQRLPALLYLSCPGHDWSVDRPERCGGAPWTGCAWDPVFLWCISPGSMPVMDGKGRTLFVVSCFGIAWGHTQLNFQKASTCCGRFSVKVLLEIRCLGGPLPWVLYYWVSEPLESLIIHEGGFV